MSCLNCCENFTFRHVINLALIVAFMSSVIANVYKYSQKNTVVAESTRSASEVTYPSITMCPRYNLEFAVLRASGTKKLTEYYESLLRATQIKKDIISISQPYITKNGCVYRTHIND